MPPPGTPCSKAKSLWNAAAALPPSGPTLAIEDCGAETCLIEVRGDLKQFKLSLLTEAGFDSINYQASFAPARADWQTLHLPLADFRASIRGREVPDAPPLDPACIHQVGLMIASRQAGPFALDIRRISLF